MPKGSSITSKFSTDGSKSIEQHTELQGTFIIARYVKTSTYTF